MKKLYSRKKSKLHKNIKLSRKKTKYYSKKIQKGGTISYFTKKGIDDNGNPIFKEGVKIKILDLINEFKQTTGMPQNKNEIVKKIDTTEPNTEYYEINIDGETTLIRAKTTPEYGHPPESIIRASRASHRSRI